MSDFNRLMEMSSKATEQYITPRSVYSAKFGDCIVIKYSRAEILFIFEDGFYKLVDVGIYHDLIKKARKSKNRTKDFLVRKLL